MASFTNAMSTGRPGRCSISTIALRSTHRSTRSFFELKDKVIFERDFKGVSKDDSRIRNRQVAIRAGEVHESSARRQAPGETDRHPLNGSAGKKETRPKRLRNFFRIRPNQRRRICASTTTASGNAFWMITSRAAPREQTKMGFNWSWPAMRNKLRLNGWMSTDYSYWITPRTRRRSFA